MSGTPAEHVANAVLYEGYMLYPYRPSSVKNRERWNFGVVYPQAYSESQNGADNWFMQTECLAVGSSSTKLKVKVRFLQAVARTIGKLAAPADEWEFREGMDQDSNLDIVETLQVGEQTLQPWQEAIEREFVASALEFAGPQSAQCSSMLVFPGGKEFEAVRGPSGPIVGAIVRTKETLAAKVEVTATQVENGLFKITVRLSNIISNSSSENRQEALMQSLLSAHTILNLEDGNFVSLLDPPESLKSIVTGCNNIGTWPVLAGETGQRDCMLSSPIILYDYPQIAPESPGDLFDGTEIDEILALRILTLTEDEKHEMRNADDRARRILERTETLPTEHFMKLHGVLRALRPGGEGKP